MKMKKLTALALAGVLCLGMSTTAFAAPSVETGDGDVTIYDAEGNESDKKLYDKNTKQEIKDGDVKIDTSKEIDTADYKESMLDTGYDLWSNDGKGNEVLQDAIVAAGGVVKKDAQVVILDSADITSNVDFDKANKDGIETLRLKFNMSGYKIPGVDGYGDPTKLTDKDTVYLMHWVDKREEWVCIEATLAYDEGVLYAYADFNTADGLSPVVFVATRGGTTTEPGTEPGTQDPGTNVRPGTDVTPSDIVGSQTNGTVTVDDIANAIVNRLQAANVRAVRTVSTGVSPRTGE